MSFQEDLTERDKECDEIFSLKKTQFEKNKFLVCKTFYFNRLQIKWNWIYFIIYSIIILSHYGDFVIKRGIFDRINGKRGEATNAFHIFVHEKSNVTNQNVRL